MKKILLLFLSFILFCGSAGCKNGGESAEDEQMELGTVDKLVQGFWEGDTVYDETVILVAKTDENGLITAMPSAQLLYEPTEIIEVKQYFHADNSGIVLFEENKDYTVSEKTITAKGRVVPDFEGNMKLVETSMPYITDRQMNGTDVFPGLASTNTGIPSKDGGYIPYTESYQIVQLQVSVTYKHASSWTGTVPSYQGDDAAGLMQKLRGRERVELLVFGDSIFTGSNSSSVLNITPYLKTWPELVADNLARYYGATVRLTNRSMGGWTSTHAVSSTPLPGWVGGEQITQVGLPSLMEGELSDYSPDLAFIGFGMNDATLGVSKNAYVANIRKLIDCIKERNPDCVIVLVGTMRANPMAADQDKDQAEYSALHSRIIEMYYADSGVICVDVGEMHQQLLDAGKKYMDMTGNNVNHPNDFLARVYAMTVLSAFIG